MRLDLSKTDIRIVPETIQDEIYLEEVLNLVTREDKAEAIRTNIYGTSSMAYVRLQRKEE